MVDVKFSWMVIIYQPRTHGHFSWVQEMALVTAELVMPMSGWIFLSVPYILIGYSWSLKKSVLQEEEVQTENSSQDQPEVLTTERKKIWKLLTLAVMLEDVSGLAMQKHSRTGIYLCCVWVVMNLLWQDRRQFIHVWVMSFLIYLSSPLTTAKL